MIGWQWSILDKCVHTRNYILDTQRTQEHVCSFFLNDAINLVACHASISETHQEKFMQHIQWFLFEIFALLWCLLKWKPSFRIHTHTKERLPNIDLKTTWIMSPAYNFKILTSEMKAAKLNATFDKKKQEPK